MKVSSSQQHYLYKRRIVASILVLYAVLLVACTSARTGKVDVYGALGSGADLVPFLPQVRTGTLPNGLRYYIYKNAKPENRAFLTLAVNAGSILEQDNQQGLAHFVEHLAFKNTANFPNGTLLDYLRSLGMRFGPDINAYTSYNSTVYGIEVPTEIGPEGGKRIPPRALAVLNDWSWAVAFTPQDVDEERPVVLEEYRLNLGASQRIQKIMLPVLLAGSTYWQRSPIGLPEILQSATAQDLLDFYATWYRTDNMALILVGDFDDQALEQSLASHFTAPPPSGPLHRPVYELPNPQKGRFAIETITDPEYQYSRVDFYYKGNPITEQGTLRAFRTGIMDLLIDQIVSLRFDEAALKPDCPYIAAGIGTSRYGLTSNFNTLSVISKPGMLQASLQAVLREKESITRYGFGTGEISRAKNELLSDLQRMVSEKDRQESSRFIWSFTNHFLSGQNTADVEWEYDAALALLPGITAKDLLDRAKSYYAMDDLTVIQILPESEQANQLESATIRRLISASRRERIPRPQEEAQPQTLLAHLPLGGSIIQEQWDAASDTLWWELSNGARVILKETANRNNEILLYAMARGGTTSSPEEEDISATLSAEIMEVSGIGTLNRTELIRALSGHQASLGFSASHFYRTLSGSATTEDAGTLFELLYLTFTQPRIDQDAVAAMIDQYRTVLSQRKESPESIFYDELYSLIYGGNLRFRSMELEDLAKINPEDALRFVQRGMNPADYTFIFVGNIDIATIKAYIETYLAGIPPKTPWNAWDAVDFTRPAALDQRVYKGQEEKSYVFLGWFLEEEYTEKEGIAAAVLSEYLDILLIQEIREKLGGVYTISAEASLSPFPPPGWLSLDCMFACDPGRAAELIAAVTTQVERIARGAIDQETFATAVETRKKSFEESMQSNSFIARNYANLEVIYDLPLSRLETRPALYDQITLLDLQQLCQRILAQDRISLTLYPESWQE